MVGATITGWCSIVTPSTAGASVVVGVAEITTPDGVTQLKSGGSTADFGVALPSGASCPGDTAHDFYHVFSYLEPVGEPVTSVSFKTGLPSKGLGFIADGAYYGAINTVENSGQVATFPSEFSLSRFTPQLLFGNGERTAVWDGGMACANVHGVVTNYWNTEFVFRTSTTDPGGWTWAIEGPDAVPSSNGHLPWFGISMLAVALALAGTALQAHRRRSREVADVDG